MSFRALGAWCVLACAALGGCARQASDDAGAREPLVPVEARAAELRRFEDRVIAPGQWRSAGELVVMAPFTATVDSLGPRIGDTVIAGENMGWLVTRESQAALRGAELMAREARDPAAREEAARARSLARRDLVRVPLVAPRSGVVVRRAVETGGQVAEGGEILALVSTGAIVFEAHVAAADAARLHPGQPATIVTAGRAPRAARVQRLLPAASASDQTLLVWLAPLGGAGAPELDRFGTASIVVGPPRRAVAVPDSALIQDDLTGATRIAVIGQDGRAIWQTVKLGPGEDGWHALADPSLKAGTRVIVEGQRGLPDSARVKLGP